jgi:hypothetical protein
MPHTSCCGATHSRTELASNARASLIAFRVAVIVVIEAARVLLLDKGKARVTG